MLKLPLFFAILFSIPVLAQDFRCIVPDEDRFFMDGTMLGLRVIDSDTNSVGIIHNFQYDVRAVSFGDASGCNPVTSCEENPFTEVYFTQLGASWMGKAMLEKSDGNNIFLNFNGDTIVINTLAGLNESWSVYHWGDTAKLDATVTEISTETVLGVSQFVKTISFQAYDSSGVEIAHPLNAVEWKLSQFEGFTQVHSLYWFPNFPDPETLEAYQCDYWGFSGQEHFSNSLIQLTSQKPPTEGEMYDFEVGDEFQFRETETSWNPHLRYFRCVAIDKSYIGNSLSITFSRETIYTNTETVALDTFVITSADTSNIFPNNKLPGQAVGSNNLNISALVDTPHLGSYYFANGDEILDSLYSKCEFRAVRLESPQNLFSFSSACANYSSQSDGTYGPVYFFAGIPISASHEGGLGGNWETVPIYVNTSTCQFGSRMYVGLDEPKRQTIAIHPNPTTSLLRFESKTQTNFSISDLMGRTIQSGIARIGQNEITVSTLPDGVYFLRLESANAVARFVKTAE
jgi:hypothetical protein